MSKQLTVRSTSSNLAAICLEKKHRLEAALAAAIDNQTRLLIERELARIEQLEARRKRRSFSVA